MATVLPTATNTIELLTAEKLSELLSGFGMTEDQIDQVISSALAIGNEPLIETAEAAEVLSMDDQTLRNWRSRKVGGPPFYRVSGGRIRYRKSDLEAYIRSCRQRPVM